MGHGVILPEAADPDIRRPVSTHRTHAMVRQTRRFAGAGLLLLAYTLALAPAPALAQGQVAGTVTATPAVSSATVPEAVTAQHPDLPVIRDAVTAYRKGDLAGGDTLRARATSAGARALLDWVALRFGTAPFERVMAFRMDYPDYPNPSWLRRRGEDSLLQERKGPALVMAYFARERPQTPTGKLVLAQALETSGFDDDAAALIRDAWRNDVFGRDLEARILDAFKETLTTADHRFRMERLLLRENWEAARRAGGYAGAGYDALVKARIAVDGRARNAAKLLETVPPQLKSDTSWLFSQVQSLRRADKAGEAAKTLQDLSRDPAVLADGDVWWVERRLVARKLLDDGDAKAAYGVAIGHGTTTPERRIEAEFHAGWIALRFLNDPATARRHFDRAAAVALTPISQGRAAYWQGRAAEAAGSPEAAAGFYRAASLHGITYYGQLAAAKLGLPIAIRAPLDPAGGPRRDAAASPLVQALALAYAANLREIAVPLAVEFARGETRIAELEAVSDVVAQNGDARTLLTVGKLATQRGLPLDEAAFPTFGVPAFEQIEPKIEAAMVPAIARQESAFDPAAGSGVGARGLMQLMPGTAQATAKKVGERYEPGRILEATYNARLGAAHLGHLMEDWKGSLILVFASYNAGAGNVKKWIAQYGDPRNPDVDAIDWVERIPFSETRNYVQRVMENLEIYRRLSGPLASGPGGRDARQPGGAKVAGPGPVVPVAPAVPRP